MTTESALRALAGGAMIGVAASLCLIVHGRIAGISGTLGRALDSDGGRAFRLAFLVGMVATGALAATAMPGAFGPNAYRVEILAIAGVLVGFGTTLANGCTSGHGVCGISRGSKRSFVAVVTFIGTAMLSVAIAKAVP